MDRSLGKMVVGNILATAAIRYPDAPAIYCSSTDRRFSFGEINDRTNRLAQALLGLGFRKGDVVAFLTSNRAEIVEIYFALARTGIVGLPLNYRLAAAEMLELMRAMGASGLIYEGRFATIAEPAAKTLKHVIQFGGEKTSFALDYETVLSAASPETPDIEIDEADPYYFNLTSGTTGLPKSYVLTQYNNSTLGPMFQIFDMTRRDVTMTVFPAFGRVGFAWIAGSILYGIPHVAGELRTEGSTAPDCHRTRDDLQPGSDHGGDAAAGPGIRSARPQFHPRHRIRGRQPAGKHP